MGMYGYLLHVDSEELDAFLALAQPKATVPTKLPPHVSEEHLDRVLEGVLPIVVKQMPGGSSPDRIAKLKKSARFRQALVDLLYANKGDATAVQAWLSQREERALHLEKAFHALHWLLTSRTYGGDPPLGNAVLGGTGIGPDIGYGPVRYLNGVEVGAVWRALEPLSPDVLLNRWDLKAARRAKIYAVADKDGKQECRARYGQLRDYYSAATSEGHSMLLYIL